MHLSFCRLTLRLVVLLLALVLPVGVSAQTGFGNDNSPPTVSFSPASGSSFTSAQVTVTITWHDETVLDQSTLSITLNGQNVAGSFTYSGSNTSATSVGTITLAGGTNTLAASMCDEQPNCPSSPTTATYTYNPPPPPPPSTYTVVVTPDAGTAAASTATTGLTQAFTVKNTGTASADYTFGVTCTAPVACAPPPTPVTVASGASATVSLGYLTGSTAGTGHIQLLATRSGYTTPSDSGSVDVVVSPTGVQVDLQDPPDGATTAQVSVPLGVKTKRLGAGASLNVSVARNGAGERALTAVGIEIGGSISLNPVPRGAGGDLTGPNSYCRGDRPHCSK
jgi:hypothetical protein